MLQRRRERPQCSHDNCGSRRFHVDDDGFTYCDQGHQQSELGTVIAEDTGELTTLGKTSRRRVDSDVESQTSRVSAFSGTKAFEHFLLCLQLVLRKQARWLIEQQDLPEELEPLVRDLWALHLQKQRTKSSNDSGTDTEPGSSRYTSQSETDTDRESWTSRTKRSASRRARQAGPNLRELICIIYVAALLLRIPLTIADLHGWISTGDLPYYRAGKEISLSMLERLPGELQRLLEPHSPLTAEQLHGGALSLLSSMHTESGMHSPPLNDPLITYRWISTLLLPIEVFTAVQRLASALQIDFTYSVNAAAWSNLNLRCPEIRLMALIVIATKLIFPFHSGKWYPASASDLAALKMDWEVWVELQNLPQDTAVDRVRKSHLNYMECFTLKGKDAEHFDNGQIDGYLDWYEWNIATEDVRERGKAGREADFRKALFRMFPTAGRTSHPRVQLRTEDPDAGNTSAGLLRQAQSALLTNHMVPPVESEDVPRLGSSYVQYKSEADLTGPVRTLYERAARLAGISGRGMLKAVFSMERRLMDREKDLKKSDEVESSSSAA